MNLTAQTMLPKIVLFRKEANGVRRATGVLLPFLLEQLIASGATKIIINDAWRYKDSISKLPKIYDNYITLENEEERATEISKKVFGSIFDELGVQINGCTFILNNKNADEDTIDAAINSYSNFIEFVNATLCKSQLQLDINRMKNNLLLLQQNLRGIDSRAHASCIIPIFSSYSDINIPGVKISTQNNPNISEKYHEILRSSEFNLLSEARYALGIRRTLNIAINELRHKVRKLLSLRPAKPLISYSSSIASVATGIPVPSSDVVESLLSESYMPPIIDMSRQIKNARKGFLSASERSDEFVELPFDDETE